MTSTQRRSNFSTLLRLALILVLCFLFLKCEAAPESVEMDEIKTREFFTKEKLNEQDLMTSQGGKSRQKRFKGIGKVTPRAGEVIPGIAPEKTTILTTGSFPDGKICFNGEEPYTPAEIEASKKFSGVDVEAAQFVDPADAQKNTRPEWVQLCTSKKCNFSPKTQNYLCGDVQEGVFDDGKICVDGSTPSSKAMPSSKIPQAQHDGINQMYGKWCKSKKCIGWLVGDKVHPVCGTVTVGDDTDTVGDGTSGTGKADSFFLLVVTLLGLSVLQNLQ